MSMARVLRGIASLLPVLGYQLCPFPAAAVARDLARVAGVLPLAVGPLPEQVHMQRATLSALGAVAGSVFREGHAMRRAITVTVGVMPLRGGHAARPVHPNQ